MAVKVVLALLVLAIVISVAMVMAFKYFERKAELDHEKELQEMEQTEKLFED